MNKFQERLLLDEKFREDIRLNCKEYLGKKATINLNQDGYYDMTESELTAQDYVDMS